MFAQVDDDLYRVRVIDFSRVDEFRKMRQVYKYRPIVFPLEENK